MQAKKVLIMAGGTGGHVFPALAIAKALKNNGSEILWLGTRGRMEEVLVPKHGFDIRYIDVQGIRRNGLLRKLKAPFMVLNAICQSRAVFKEFKPDLVIGMGGYASGPGGICAKLMGVPLLLHEQNAAAGLTNKLLSKLAKVIFLGFPGAFTGNKVMLVGNPVRESILSLYNKKKDFSGKLNLLIVGGSLGAKALNEIVPYVLEHSNLNYENLTVYHQTGKGNSEKTKELYKDYKGEVVVTDFIDDMDKALDMAHLIICRAGALTCTEVGCANLPAIFVPLPTAVDDHQTFNARTMESAQASIIVAQKDLKEKLGPVLEDLTTSPSKLALMSENTHKIACIDATDKILKKIAEL